MGNMFETRGTFTCQRHIFVIWFCSLDKYHDSVNCKAEHWENVTECFMYYMRPALR